MWKIDWRAGVMGILKQKDKFSQRKIFRENYERKYKKEGD